MPTSAGFADPTIRQLLNRRELAALRHRAALSKKLGLGDTEMLAVMHLAHHGELIPAALGGLLDLSSGAVTALVQRMETSGHIIREPHPTDGRSVLIRLAPDLVRRAQAGFRPLVRELDRLSAELSENEQVALRRFLERAARVTEEYADRVRESLVPQKGAGAAAPSPGLWG
jgi:DNA-binding MarR family transcriptional regulator